MKQLRTCLFFAMQCACMAVLSLSGCDRQSANAAKADAPTAASTPVQKDDVAADTLYFARPLVVSTPKPDSGAQNAGTWTGPFTDLDWTDLAPKNDPNRGYPTNVTIDHTGTRRMPQFGSFNTVRTLDGKHVRLPGYVVPLQTDDAGRMTEFFFVPFYGACIHVPPPPPNQMVFAKMAIPVKTPDIYTAMSMVGTLHASKHDDALASAAYTMDDAALTLYEPTESTND